VTAAAKADDEKAGGAALKALRHPKSRIFQNLKSQDGGVTRP